MRIELTRIIADWLLHPTYGVNAYLPVVPRDAGDPAPPAIREWADTVNPQVQARAVFDDTRHAWVIRREDPPAMPCLMVGTTGPIDMTGESWPDGQYKTSQQDVEIAVAYVTSEEDVFVAVRDGDYTLRAVARSLQELSRNANVASRTRNGVLLISFQNPMRYVPMNEVVGASRFSGGILANVHAEDGNPSWAAQ